MITLAKGRIQQVFLLVKKPEKAMLGIMELACTKDMRYEGLHKSHVSRGSG